MRASAPSPADVWQQEALYRSIWSHAGLSNSTPWLLAYRTFAL